MKSLGVKLTQTNHLTSTQVIIVDITTILVSSTEWKIQEFRNRFATVDTLIKLITSEKLQNCGQILKEALIHE